MTKPIRAQGISIHVRSAPAPRISRQQAAVIMAVLRLIAIGVSRGPDMGFDYRGLPAEVLLAVLSESI